MDIESGPMFQVVAGSLSEWRSVYVLIEVHVELIVSSKIVVNCRLRKSSENGGPQTSKCPHQLAAVSARLPGTQPLDNRPKRIMRSQKYLFYLSPVLNRDRRGVAQ